MNSFYITRPAKRAGGRPSGEWLKGEVEDAESEARALLSDPRDTIDAVFLWLGKYNQFNGIWWTKASLARLDAKREGGVR